MTSEVTRPQDLEPLKQPLIEAVINAYMRKYTAGTGGLVGDRGSCSEGEFRFKAPTGDNALGFDLERDPRFYCSYPGGAWKEDVSFLPDSDASVGDHPVFGDVQLFDAKALFEDLTELVSSWIDPFIACHSPNEFNNQIAILQNIINELYVQDEVRVGDTSITGEDPGTTTSPTGSIRTAIVDMQSTLAPLLGLAIDNLKKNYTNDIGLTISGQRALATVAGLAIYGERTAWSNAYADLVKFFKSATDEFNSFADSGGADHTQTLTIISGLSGIASGLTAPIAPLSGGLAVVSGVTALAANYAPKPSEATIVKLSGGDYPSLWSSFEQAVRDIESDLATAEIELSTMVSQALADYDANPGSYSISAPRRFLGAGEDAGQSELYANDGVHIVHSRLRQVAGMTEHIADHQRLIAGQAPSALNKDEWIRGSLQGSPIGWGTDGHYPYFEKIVDALTDLLLHESKQLHRIAEHCLEISHDFQATDQQIETELDKLESRIDA